MQKSKVTTEKMPDFTRRRASSAEAQVGEDADSLGVTPVFLHHVKIH